MVFDLKAEETPADGSLRRSVLKPPFTSYAPGPGESGRGGSSSDAATEPRREPRGEAVALEVVAPHEGLAVGDGEPRRGARADAEADLQARPRGRRDRVDVRRGRQPRGRQRLGHDAVDRRRVGVAREPGHDAAVRRVHRVLRHGRFSEDDAVAKGEALKVSRDSSLVRTYRRSSLEYQ